VRIDVTELQQPKWQRPGPAADDTEVLEAVPPSADTGETGETGEPADIEDRDDLAAALAKAAPKRWWNRGTAVLGAVALLLGGFLGGLQVQKHWGAAATTTNRAGAFGGANRNAAGGYAGFPGAGTGRTGGGFGNGTGATPTASAAAATTGTVKLVDGSTIYVQTPSGDVITVKTTGKTSVQAATKTSLKSLKAGQAVTVQGPAGTDGTVTATSVTAGK
jgi:hypothetical protein